VLICEQVFTRQLFSIDGNRYLILRTANRALILLLHEYRGRKLTEFADGLRQIEIAES
jgi:hypothetical protein